MTKRTVFLPYPIIGIRPVIDSRHDVYETSQAQIMAMAEQVKDLLETSLVYPDGTPIQCIVHDGCISNAGEARRCSEKFAKNNVCAVISVAAGWCYPLETLEENLQLPHAIWGFNGTERPGAVYLAAVTAAANLIGLPLFRIYGRDVQDKDCKDIPEDVVEKLLRFARSAVAVGMMKNKSYLSLGSVSMGIAGSIVDREFFARYLGMRVAYVDMTELERRMQQNIYDEEEFKRGMQWISEKCVIGQDNNPPDKMRSEEQKHKDWEESLKMTLVIRDMMDGNPSLSQKYPEEAVGYDALAAGFQGQRAWNNFRVSGDFMEAVLNSGFDWNGARIPYIVATENDGLNAVSMLFGNLLTNCAQVFCDVRTYWSAEAINRVTGHKVEGLSAGGIIHLINSGSAALEGTGAMSDESGNPVIKPFWETSEADIDSCLNSVKWCPDLLDQFYGGGYSSSYSTRGNMPVTMVRVNVVHGIGLVLQLAEGYTVELPEEVHNELLERTDPTWPSTWFCPEMRENSPFDDVYDLMDSWGANHCSLCYGHIGDDLITLASMLRIPVGLHNIPKQRVMRPAIWKAYGVGEQYAIDREVCKKLGSLY
ncbi:L-fucose isomerase [Lachnospiraceae bacterium ZAX-1]